MNPCVLTQNCTLYPKNNKYPNGIEYPQYTLGLRTDTTVTFGVPEPLEYSLKEVKHLQDIPGNVENSYGIMMHPTESNLSIWREHNQQIVNAWLNQYGPGLKEQFAKKCPGAATSKDEIITKAEGTLFGNMYNCHVWYEVKGEIHDYGPNVILMSNQIMFGTEYEPFSPNLEEYMKDHFINLWQTVRQHDTRLNEQQNNCVSRAMVLHQNDGDTYNIESLRVGSLGIKLSDFTYRLYGSTTPKPKYVIRKLQSEAGEVLNGQPVELVDRVVDDDGMLQCRFKDGSVKKINIKNLQKINIGKKTVRLRL